MIRHTKGKKPTPFEETKQASEPKSDMAGILEILEQQFKITIMIIMINMLNDPMVKVDDMQE